MKPTIAPNKPSKKSKPSLRASIATLRPKVLAQIGQIRSLWAEGFNDAEIRDQLDMGWLKWKRRIRVMRAIPPDETVISSYRRYYAEHTKAVDRMHDRMKKLKAIYDRAIEEISIYDNRPKVIGKKKGAELVLITKRPRDLHLAASTSRDMATLDREILKMEQELITVKQKLGMIDTFASEPDEDDVFGDDAILITAGNLMKAWSLRKARRLEQNKQLEQQHPEEAVIVGKSNGVVK